jgi:hypothetical protein
MLRKLFSRVHLQLEFTFVHGIIIAVVVSAVRIGLRERPLLQI